MIMNSRGEIQETGRTYSPNTTEIWKKNVILLHMAVWYQRIFERDRAATFDLKITVMLNMAVGIPFTVQVRFIRWTVLLPSMQLVLVVFGGRFKMFLSIKFDRVSTRRKLLEPTWKYLKPINCPSKEASLFHMKAKGRINFLAKLNGIIKLKSKLQ